MGNVQVNATLQADLECLIHSLEETVTFVAHVRGV